ncbi:MAG: hypothetical protein ACXVEE_06740, partial [Polyangiales bacterium]
KQLRGGGPTEFRLLPGEPVTGLAAAAGDQLCRTVIVSGKGGLVRCGPRDFTDVVDTTERPGTAPIVGMPKAACYFDWATFIPGSGCTGFWGGGLFGYTVGKGGVQHRTLAAYDDFLWIVGDIVIGSANPLTGDDGPRIIPPPAPDVSAIAVDGKGVALGTSSGRIYLVDRSSGKQALLACDEGPVTAIALNATDVLWIRPTDGALRAAKR